jgi:predicted cupin superfamily sugar epimerase
MKAGILIPENYSAEDVVRLLQLAPLEQEGGYYRRTAESDVILPGTGRRAYSVIYMLVTPTGFSAMHRLGTDEIWTFHAGDALESLRLAPDGSGKHVRLGLNLAEDEKVQDVIPAKIWQGTRLRPGGRWGLVSCVVAPEFRWSDFELGDRAGLVAAYPAFSAEISTLTR